MARLLAAMSGGVDSSVAAALAVREGHEVVGVTLRLWDDPEGATRVRKGCAFQDAVADARRVADVLGIPHYALDATELFAREVIEPFVAAYARGETPNPCVRCNELVRFGALLERAEALGFEGLVTGHYARVRRAEDGTWRLWRARDPARDQSYVLYALGQGVLGRVHWPLGEVSSKAEVRALAAWLGLPTWNREDSVEVCFVPEGRRPGDLVAERAPEAARPGPIVDRDGRVLGWHRGLAYYTVGQRRGLGALGARRYVAAIDPARNALVVGGEDELLVREVHATRPRFVTGCPPPDGTELTAVLRYQGAGHRGRFFAEPGGFRVELASPARAAAPGQAVVLYDGDEVVGGGTIARAG